MKIGYKSESGAVWWAIAAGAVMYMLPKETLWVTIPSYLVVSRYIARGARNKSHALCSTEVCSDTNVKLGEPKEEQTLETKKESSDIATEFSLDDSPQTRPVAIVTGTNSGIGYWTAVGLAAEGYEVIVTCRSKSLTQTMAKQIAAEAERQRGKQRSVYSHAPQPIIVTGEHPIECDNFDSIRCFVAWCVQYCEHRQLAILVNNAGGMQCQFEFSSFNPSLEWHTAVNFLGPFLLTELLLPLLERHGGRVVYVSSEAHRGPQMLLEHERLAGNKRSLRDDGLSSGGVHHKLLHALHELNQGVEKATGPLANKSGTYSCFIRYGTSKLLNTYHAHHIARRYATSVNPSQTKIDNNNSNDNNNNNNSNIHRVYACSLHPGCVATNFSRGIFRWNFLLQIYSKLSLLFLKTPEEGAQTSLHCALCPAEELELVTRYAKPLSKGKLPEPSTSAEPNTIMKEESVSPYFVECAEKTQNMLLAYGWDVEEAEAIVSWARGVVGL